MIIIVILLFVICYLLYNKNKIEPYDAIMTQKQLLGSSIVRSNSTQYNNINDLLYVEPSSKAEPMMYIGNEMSSNFDDKNIIESLCVAILKNTVFDIRNIINLENDSDIIDDVLNDDNLKLLDDNYDNYKMIVEYIVQKINKICDKTLNVSIKKSSERISSYGYINKFAKYNKKFIDIDIILIINHPIIDGYSSNYIANEWNSKNIEALMNIKLIIEFFDSKKIKLKIKDLIIKNNKI